jgi:hypothetical protein
MTDTGTIISDWRRELEGEQYVGATRAQDRLLALWGELGDAGTALVEQWLVISRDRQLFSAAELLRMLEELEDSTNTATAASN